METVSLDLLAANPALADKLPVEALAALALQCAAAQAAIAAALLKRAQERAHDESAGDKLLTVPEAAKVLSVPPNYLYRNGQRLGLITKLGDGTVRISRARLLKFIREQGRDGLNAA